MKKTMQKYPCAVLCGGRSVRFGSNKLHARLAGQSLLEHVVARVRPQCSHLAFANQQSASNLHSEIKNLPDAVPDRGPLSGVLSAMAWAQNLGFSRVFTTPADTPFIPSNWARKLSETQDNIIAIACVEGRQHRVSALWPVGLSPSLRHVLRIEGNNKVGAFIKMNAWENIEFSKQAGVDPFFNINTYADLKQARILLKSSS